MLTQRHSGRKGSSCPIADELPALYVIVIDDLTKNNKKERKSADFKKQKAQNNPATIYLCPAFQSSAVSSSVQEDLSSVMCTCMI